MNADVVVIGAGIAGASLAAELVAQCRVVLVEAEDTPGYHSTGRSAAFWHETLGGPRIQPLTRASFAALKDGGYLKPRAAMEVATHETLPLLDALEAEGRAAGASLIRVGRPGLLERLPRAAPELIAAVVEPLGGDIDVAAFHGDCLARFRRAGGTLLIGGAVTAIAPRRSVSLGGTTIVCDTVVNAAGAWADAVAAMAGARPLGIQPKRRTIVQVRVDADDVPADLPLVMDVAGQYYFRPEGPDRLWLCPHDETPVDPHDVAPEELDIAIAIDRFEAVASWRVAQVERSWAGLRSFAPDRLPVFGFDPRVSGFFWCAGQGGIGIQTAPAAARLCAHLILGGGALPPSDVKAAWFAPERFEK